MKFELPPLPYAKDALEPHLSAETLEVHYERHHRGYLKKLQNLIDDKPEAEKPLEAIVREAKGPIYNNAAQLWNHTFYWRSMHPRGGGEPRDGVAAALKEAFGSVESFKESFAERATGLFGSGYVWLYWEPERERLRLRAMKDADSPLLLGGVPLLGIDMWEHAYYIDYRNEKAKYVKAFLEDLLDWDFAEENLRAARRG